MKVLSPKLRHEKLPIITKKTWESSAKTDLALLLRQDMIPPSPQVASERASEESKVSSVLVDESGDSEVIRVDNQGFHPKHTTIQKVGILGL